jgi:predicted lipoprotein with Yx(FWY)xxD motif
LYYFAHDRPAAGDAVAVSGCAGPCLLGFPAFHAASADVGPGLHAADFGEITGTAGAPQTTYKGWPLYTFVDDGAAGDLNGDNFAQVWFVLRDPFYTVLVMGKVAGPTHYLADPAGRTLYLFTRDTVGTDDQPPVSACTAAACLANFTPYAGHDSVVPTGVTPVTGFARADGAVQSAWRGHPLYYFNGDLAPGDTKGDGFGDAWTILDPTAP